MRATLWKQRSGTRDRKSTRLNSSHVEISYAVFCLKKKKHNHTRNDRRTDHQNDQPRQIGTPIVRDALQDDSPDGRGGSPRFALVCCFFFFNDTATTEIYTLSLHDALPISPPSRSLAPSWSRPKSLRPKRCAP